MMPYAANISKRWVSDLVQVALEHETAIRSLPTQAYTAFVVAETTPTRQAFRPASLPFGVSATRSQPQTNTVQYGDENDNNSEQCEYSRCELILAEAKDRLAYAYNDVTSTVIKPR